MKIFISYASEQQAVAEEIYHALLVCSHEVFFAPDSIRAGEEYHRRIQEEIRASDVFIFLVSPASVAPGGYARTELRFAQENWDNPLGHVLPFFAEETPISLIPVYLSTISIRLPAGNLVAEVVAAVNDLASGWNPGHSLSAQAKLLEATQLKLDLALLRQELATLDAEWDKEKLKFYISTKDGVKVPPTHVSGIITIGAGIVIPVFLMSFPQIDGSPIPFLMVLIPCILIGLGIYNIDKAQSFESAQSAYQAERDRLEQKIRDAEKRILPE